MIIIQGSRPGASGGNNKKKKYKYDARTKKGKAAKTKNKAAKAKRASAKKKKMMPPREPWNNADRSNRRAVR